MQSTTSGPLQAKGDVLAYLTVMLQQLEGAQGGEPDHEARQKLELLKAQLLLMENAQQGRCEATEAVLQTEVAVAQELDSLDTRLMSLEQRLDGLDDDARQLVQHSVAGWVGAADEGPGTEIAHGSNGQSGGS